MTKIKVRIVETRYEALDAIGHALKRGLVSFAEATKLRDLARSGRVDEVEKRLTTPAPTRRS